MTHYYPITPEEKERLDKDFTYHAPFDDQPERYEKLRSKGKDLAEEFMLRCPRGRELSLALTNLEEAIMWANAAIARNEQPIEEPVSITRQAVESSNLVSVGYDGEHKVLEIEFHSGYVYRYFDVPMDIFDDLIVAESVGKFFHENIRDFFRFEQVGVMKEEPEE